MRFNRKFYFFILFLLTLLTIVCVFVVYPQSFNNTIRKALMPIGIELPEIKFPFRLGLDLSGGTSLVYVGDLKNIPEAERADAMAGLKDVVERRVNFLGVTEPNITVAKSGEEWRLIVDLAGIHDPVLAMKVIGETPFLEFKEERIKEETDKILESQKNNELLDVDPYYQSTNLTGQLLKKSELSFDNTSGAPIILLNFNKEGTETFADLTAKNIGKTIAIYLDGVPISAPRVQEAIPSGEAQITGKFSVQEAKVLVQRLNQGALPVPISPIAQHTVGPILGAEFLNLAIYAGLLGSILIAAFMIIIYRISGIFASLALAIYVLIVLTLFKLIPVTVTLSGIAGFVLSIGMAVDANILIFSRVKEELRSGLPPRTAIEAGFKRAWPSIRDSNITTLITMAILFYLASGFVKGFALTLAIGVLASMFSAIFITGVFIRLFTPQKIKPALWFG